MMNILLVTATLVLVSLTSTTSNFPVYIKLLAEDSRDDLIYINFYEDFFLKLFSCMASTESRTCTAELIRDDKHPNEADDRRVRAVDKPELLNSFRAYKNVFTCIFSKLDQKLACSRLFINATSCENHHPTQYFSLTNSSSVGLGCVGLKWKTPNESLVYDSTVDGIEMCNSSCSTDSQNSSGGKLDNQSRLPRPTFGTRVTESFTNKLHRGDKDNNDHHENYTSKTHIIIAVVVSMFVTATLILSAFLFRRNIMLLKKAPSSNEENGDSSSDHENISNSFQLGKTNTLNVYPPETDDRHPSVA